MDEVFKSFCAFGAGKDSAPMMDGAKLAKLTRDLKLLDKKLTSTDVDIMFNKVKAKTERKITFKQFQEVVKLMAAKKFPDDEGAYDKLKDLICTGKGPATKGTKQVKTGAVDRLTDTSKYTGSHKERFDDTGKGKGIGGRVELVDEKAAAGYVGGYKEKDSYDKKH